MTYRKKKSSDTWHFCKNCTNWPTSDYEEIHYKPTNGELCNQCKSKQQTSQCSQ